MTDIERAAFEEWFEAEIKPKMNGTAIELMTKEIAFAGWQARASSPVVVTDEMVEAVARKLAGQDMREDGFSEQAALDAEKGDMWRNFKNSARVAIAALNGGTDG